MTASDLEKFAQLERAYANVEEEILAVSNNAKVNERYLEELRYHQDKLREEMEQYKK
jgi:hypothetical protein